MRLLKEKNHLNTYFHQNNPKRLISEFQAEVKQEIFLMPISELSNQAGSFSDFWTFKIFFLRPIQQPQNFGLFTQISIFPIFLPLFLDNFYIFGIFNLTSINLPNSNFLTPKIPNIYNSISPTYKVLTHISKREHSWILPPVLKLFQPSTFSRLIQKTLFCLPIL